MFFKQKSVSTSSTTIHPKTRLGHVHLIVNSLDRQIQFYTQSLGFQCHWRDANVAGLGAGGEDLLLLTERKDAKRYNGTTGLYHTAFNVTGRVHLARVIKNLIETGWPIGQLVNQVSHFAIYFDDAEGNGIELALDFPREQWPLTSHEALSKRHMGDIGALLREIPADAGEWVGIDPNTRVGHVHLHVANRDKAVAFYDHLLGFESPAYLRDAPPQIARQMAFFAAGDYHHHIGTNLWNGTAAPPPPEDALGLAYYTVVLPDEDAYTRVVERLTSAEIPTTPASHGIQFHDPSQNRIWLTWEGNLGGTK